MIEENYNFNNFVNLLLSKQLIKVIKLDLDKTNKNNSYRLSILKRNEINLKNSKNIGHGYYYQNDEIIIFHRIFLFKFYLSLKKIFTSKPEIIFNNNYFFLNKLIKFKFEGYVPIEIISRDIIQILLLKRNVLLMHCGAIKIQNNLILLHGLAGSGKTKLLKEIIKYFKGVIIHDDLLLINERQISCYSNEKNSRRFESIGILDYFLFNFSTKQTSFKKFYGAHCQRMKYNKIFNFIIDSKDKTKLEKISTSKLYEKLTSIDKINFNNNNLIYKYLFANGRTNYNLFNRNKKTLLKKYLKIQRVF